MGATGTEVGGPVRQGLAQERGRVQGPGLCDPEAVGHRLPHQSRMVLVKPGEKAQALAPDGKGQAPVRAITLTASSRYGSSSSTTRTLSTDPANR